MNYFTVSLMRAIAEKILHKWNDFSHKIGDKVTYLGLFAFLFRRKKRIKPPTIRPDDIISAWVSCWYNSLLILIFSIEKRSKPLKMR